MPAASVREAIDQTSRLLAEQPEKARGRSAPATARLQDGLRCEITGPKGESVCTDMPPAMGGTASAPAPAWLLRAALASCTATTIAIRAAKLGISLTALEVEVRSVSDSRGFLGLDPKIAPGLSLISTRVKIGAADTPATQLRELAEWGDRHSVVACTARVSPGYSLKVEIA